MTGFERLDGVLHLDEVEVGVTEDLFSGEVEDDRTRAYLEGRFG